jgi:diguanylate cyclase (GGDEF)-like protein
MAAGWPAAAVRLWAGPWALGACLLVLGVVAVVAARRGRLVGRLEVEAAGYRLSFDHALVGLAVLRFDPRDTGGDWLVEHANPALAHLVCRPVEGAAWPDLLAVHDRDRARRTLAALTDGRLPAWHGENVIAVAGRSRRVHVSIAVLPATTPAPAGVRRLAVQVVDVTDRASERDRLRDLALHDALTGLPNRTLLADRLDLALAGTARSGGRVLVAFCDLDDFKAVNDSAGHAAGDHVLVTVAARLREAVRPADTVARVGGDEFVVLCPDVPDEASAAEIAERLLAALRAPVLLDGVPCHRGGSIGVALSAPAAGGVPTTPSALLHAADVAMYRAKRSGKGTVHVLAQMPAVTPTQPAAAPTAVPAASDVPAVVDVRTADRLSA